MDDFLILDESKARLHQIKESIREFLEKLRLNLHPKKTIVYPARAGIDFLGYIVWPQYRRLRGANVKRFKKRLRCFKDAYGRGEAGIEDISCFLRSWIAHANHADTWRLRYDLFKDAVFRRGEGMTERERIIGIPLPLWEGPGEGKEIPACAGETESAGITRGS